MADPRAVLTTGANSGIGLATAIDGSETSHDVIAGNPNIYDELFPLLR